MTTDGKKENVLKYTGPTSLRGIENRLLEIEHEKPMRIHNMKEDSLGFDEAEIESMDISYLDVERKKLQLKRQFILDGRGGWKAKGFWNVAVPIIVSVITAYLVAYLVLMFAPK